MKHVSLVLAFTLSACVDSPELDTSASELGLGPTVLTFYESSNFTGRSYSVTLAALDENERIKLISKPDLEAATLLGKISSVRLACGARDARAVLFDAYNTSNTSFASWSHLGGQGHTINCVAGATTSVNLHVSRPALADHVGSAYLVTHAVGVGNLNFTELFESAWANTLDELPSAASPTKTEIWLETTTRFRIRQYLTIDHWACTKRGAVFEYRVTLAPSSGKFEISFADADWICTAYANLFKLEQAAGPIREAAKFVANSKPPTAESARGFNVGAGKATSDSGRACHKAIEQAIKEGVPATTKLTLASGETTLEGAKPLCQAMIDYGIKFEAFIAIEHKAKQAERSKKYEEAGIKGAKLALMVEYDDVYWRGKACEKIDDVAVLAKATKLYQWLENANGTHTIRTYLFAGNAVKGKSEKTYMTEKAAYGGCR